jgi:hypothetical protein
MRYVVRLAAAAVLAAAAGLALSASPAHSAPCSGDSGVSVVVDFNSLGGGVQQVCLPGGGGDAASSLFPAAGFPLSYASRQPGFVCRVSGVPTSDPCVNTAPADAFWGLWWSDGDASSWTYSSLGAGSLNVPDGGMVAFSWDSVSGSAPPSASPSHPDPPASPEPSDPPPDQPDSGGDSQAPGPGSSSAPGATSSTSPSDSDDVERAPGGMKQERERKSDKSDKSDKSGDPDEVSPTAPDTSPTQAAPGSGEPVAEPDAADGLPGWVAPGLIGLLFAVSGIVLIVRRWGSDA